MSLIFRRGLSTMVPPKVASPAGLSRQKGTARLERLMQFYEKLPKGPLPESKSRGFHGWYARKYFGKNQSAAPLWHIILVLLAIGYGNEYYFHLRHHKNNAH